MRIGLELRPQNEVLNANKGYGTRVTIKACGPVVVVGFFFLDYYLKICTLYICVYVSICMTSQLCYVYFNFLNSFDPHANMRRVKAVNEFSKMGKCSLK